MTLSMERTNFFWAGRIATTRARHSATRAGDLTIRSNGTARTGKVTGLCALQRDTAVDRRHPQLRTAVPQLPIQIAGADLAGHRDREIGRDAPIDRACLHLGAERRGHLDFDAAV